MERRNESHIGTYGWMAVGAFVLAWDYYMPETLSGAADRALERHRAVTMGAIALVGAHVANLIPPAIDPIHQLAEHFRRDDD